MYEIIIASHGDMASGMKQSLQMFMDDTSHIHAICLTQEGIQIFEQRVAQLIDQVKGYDLLVLTDIAFASPFNVFAKQLATYPNGYEIIGGVNLPAILEAAVKREHSTMDDVVACFDHSVQAVIYEKQAMYCASEEDE